jgi:predicted RNA-binding protein with PUA-like domain
MMRDEMKPGDLAFFYHSNRKEPGIAGIMKIVREGYPDSTAYDPDAKYYDPKSDPDKPRWYRVDVRCIRKLKRVITLSGIESTFRINRPAIAQARNRLSIMPVSRQQWEYILTLE